MLVFETGLNHHNLSIFFLFVGLLVFALKQMVNFSTIWNLISRKSMEAALRHAREGGRATLRGCANMEPTMKYFWFGRIYYLVTYLHI